MKIYSDAAVRTGRENVNCSRVAQDYALGGESNGTSFAVVSDGHAAFGRTDVGARLLCLAATRYAGERCTKDYALLGRRLRSFALRLKQTLRLDDSDLRATCLVVYAKGSKVQAHLYGDGVLAIRNRDGTLWLKNQVWSSNLLPLLTSTAKDVRYLVARGSSLTSMIATPGRTGDLRTVSDTAPLEHLMTIATPKRSGVLEQMTASLGHVCSYDLDASSLSDVALFTNGVGAVTSKDQTMPWETVVAELMGFSPSPVAGWVRQSMNVFCNWAERSGYAIADDLSCSSLHFDHDK